MFVTLFETELSFYFFINFEIQKLFFRLYEFMNFFVERYKQATIQQFLGES